MIFDVPALSGVGALSILARFRTGMKKIKMLAY
jgi:hypothetical protein